MNKIIKATIVLTTVIVLWELFVNVVLKREPTAKQISINCAYELYACVDKAEYETRTAVPQKVLSESTDHYLYLHLASNQPMEEYGIYVIRSKKYDDVCFLYGSVDLYEDIVKEDSKLTTVFAVSVSGSKENDNKGELDMPYKSDGIIASIDKTGFFHCDLPPIPGCLIGSRDSSDPNQSVYYPEALLPTIKKVYPELKIPQDRIIKIEN